MLNLTEKAVNQAWVEFVTRLGDGGSGAVDNLIFQLDEAGVIGSLFRHHLSMVAAEEDEESAGGRRRACCLRTAARTYGFYMSVPQFLNETTMPTDVSGRWAS